MKKQFKMMPLALAIAGLCVAGTTMANDNNRPGGHQDDKDDVSISKALNVEKDVEYEGKVDVDGLIYVDSLGMAVINDTQESVNNSSENKLLDNDATLDGNALRNARGNIGVNIGAGDNNVQGNSSALAATDAAFVFGSGDAEIFIEQTANHNNTINQAVRNDALLAGNALRNARGNIGVNVAAGNSNVQKNAFAASTTSGVMSESTIQVSQVAEQNTTSNTPLDEIITSTVSITMEGGMEGYYAGEGGGVYGGTETGVMGFAEGGSTQGSYSGQSDQIGDVYPDIWRNPPSDSDIADDGQHDVHPTNQGLVAHMDLDTQTQGGSDLNGDGGALAFNDDGTYEGTYQGVGEGSYSGETEGELGFVEVGGQELVGSFTGEVTYMQHVFGGRQPQNNATLGDNVLRNARGNIGVNVAAGTNNLQNNSLAISHLDALTVSEPSIGE